MNFLKKINLFGGMFMLDSNRCVFICLSVCLFMY